MAPQGMKTSFRVALAVVVAASLLAGCAAPSKLMVAVPPEEPLPRPESGKSVIVFVRPSGVGFALEAKVTDVTSGEDMVLVGIVGSRTKVAYPVEPGERLFMVTGGENTSFMRALVEPERTYYCLVSIHMGFWIGRFYLEPVRGAETGSERVLGWLRETTTMKNSQDSYAWFVQHDGELRAKRAGKLPEWLKSSEEERRSHTLFAEDGVR